MDGCIIMSTEDGITSCQIKDKTFHNRTSEQGLLSACFNPSSGTLCRNEMCIRDRAGGEGGQCRIGAGKGGCNDADGKEYQYGESQMEMCIRDR